MDGAKIRQSLRACERIDGIALKSDGATRGGVEESDPRPSHCWRHLSACVAVINASESQGIIDGAKIRQSLRACERIGGIA